MQRLKRGNKVKVLKGHEILTSAWGVIDISPEIIGKEAVIIGSYADQYGGDDHKQYTIMFLENGSEVSWFNENDLELLEEGGENLIEQGQAIKDAIKKENTDLPTIVKNWTTKKSQQSSDTILYLFNKIGYNRSLGRGDFYQLFSEWKKAYPLFDLIMMASEEGYIKKVLTEKVTVDQKDKIIAFFKEVKQIQKTIFTNEKGE